VITNHQKEKAASVGKFRSISERWQINCETQRRSMTDLIMYAGNFGTGEVVYTWSGTNIESSIMPGTVANVIATVICLGPSKPAELDP
jgi:hypothetical protein